MSGTMYIRSDFAALRVQKDINELAKAKFTCAQATTGIEFPDGMDNMLHLVFTIAIADTAGPYANGNFTFYVNIPRTYPFHPPSVKCLTTVWHPNVDLNTGKVMMPILAKDWRPVLSINTVLLGLQLIFVEPGIDYVLNPTAAEQLQADPDQFRHMMQQMLRGGRFYDKDFPPHPRQLERLKTTALCKRRREDEPTIESVSEQSMDECMAWHAEPVTTMPMYKRARHLE